MERQYTASTYCIDFENKTVLLMYNKKLKKWLQPGGHIEGLEHPITTAIREALEETGIQIKIIGPSFDGVNIEPISVARYINKVGDMIDISYLSVPITKEIKSQEEKEAVWYLIDELEENNKIDKEIKVKVKTLYKNYKDNYV